MNTLIQSENIIVPSDLPHTKVYGGKGVHATDLLNRGLIVNGESEEVLHIVALPISTIECAILEILGQGVQQPQIVSLSGVMTKSPNGVPAIHFLFGPGAKTDLKVVVSNTFPHHPPPVQKMLEKAQSQSIHIIEMSRTEHDKKMSIIQGLMHIWLILVGAQGTQCPHIVTGLLAPWKTPEQTVVDMVHANPFAEEVIKDFFDTLPLENFNLSITLQRIIDKYLSDDEVVKFGTPNSQRILHQISNTDTSDMIFTTEDEVLAFRAGLNTSGHTFLKEKIRNIREKMHKGVVI